MRKTLRFSIFISVVLVLAIITGFLFPAIQKDSDADKDEVLVFQNGEGEYLNMDSGNTADLDFNISGDISRTSLTASDAFISNLGGWTPLNGAWKFSSRGLVGTSNGGDCCIYANDLYIDGDTSFVYEAEMKISGGGHAGGILFGVQSERGTGYPERLYCLMAAPGGKNMLVFTHKNGHAEWVESAALTESDLKAGTYKLRVEYVSGGNAGFYINGTLYKTIRIPDFEGGYFGCLTTGGATVSFNNVQYQKVEKPSLGDLNIDGAEFEGFDPDTHSYWVYVPYTTDKIKISPAFDENTNNVFIGEAKLSSGEGKEIPLEVGNNTCQIKVTHSATNVSDIYNVYIVRDVNPETIYKERTRPQYHFTPYMYQMNDPNGLVYNAYTGEYHLFFQCNRPFDTGVVGLSGTTSWGHAVSKDLVHWEELPLAVLPDTNGMAWSGSAVIDHNNTSGLFDDSTPPESRMVMFYASVGGDSTYGGAKESMVYSKDGGRTFIKYEGNPVVKNPGNMYGGGLRDPKVFWYEDPSMENGGIWVMVVVGNLHIFTSHNLIDWKCCGRPKDINGNLYDSECPDLFPLPVDGDENNIKWVYTGGGIFYIIGHMEKTGDDTVMFVAETDKIYALNGIADQGAGNPAPETYATQTFSNEKNGRVISISWLRDPSMFWKDKIWNSAQSIPMEHSLRTVNGELKLFSYPVQEIADARGDILFKASDLEVNASTDNILKDVFSTCCDIEAVIDLGDATEVGFKLRVGDVMMQELEIRYSVTDGKLYVDKTRTGGGSYLGVYEPDMVVLEGNKIKLRMLLDEICFDVYGNDGEVAVAGLIYSEFENAGMEFFTNGSSVIESLTIYDMTQKTEEEGSPKTGKGNLGAVIAGISAGVAALAAGGIAIGLALSKKKKK